MMSAREINNLVEGYIGTNAGYLKDFSYSTHDAFYQIYCGLDINVATYRAKGLTTRRAFIEILKEAKPRDQAKIIRGVFEMIPPPKEATDDAARKRLALHRELLDVAARLEPDGQVETPEIAATSEIVLEALRDAEVLLKTRGPKSAVDRVHTALHGYLKKLCSDRGAVLPTDPSLTTVFKVIREQFPEFSASIPHDAEAKRIFGSVASALDSLNTIRNRGTLAHPNEMLLDAPEAMLYINLSRAVLGYIEAKIKP
ncbi:MAG TPA: abortive infection family protein [Candidatus Acidoferrum sp.]|nr:abortive infection family protein [Candidatus Acidoferrum sp.]